MRCPLRVQDVDLQDCQMLRSALDSWALQPAAQWSSHGTQRKLESDLLEACTVSCHSVTRKLCLNLSRILDLKLLDLQQQVFRRQLSHIISVMVWGLKLSISSNLSFSKFKGPFPWEFPEQSLTTNASHSKKCVERSLIYLHIWKRVHYIFILTSGLFILTNIKKCKCGYTWVASWQARCTSPSAEAALPSQRTALQTYWGGPWQIAVALALPILQTPTLCRTWA